MRSGYVSSFCVALLAACALTWGQDASELERAQRASRAWKIALNGLPLLDKGDRKGAAAAFTEAVKEYHDTSIAWYGLAVIHTAENRIPEAIAAYRRIIVRVPSFDEYQLHPGAGWWAELELALLENVVGHSDEAIALYRDALFRGLAWGVDARLEPIPLTLVFEGSGPQNGYTAARFEAAARIAFGLLRMRDSAHFRRVADSSLGVYLDSKHSVRPVEIRSSVQAAIDQFRKAAKAQPEWGLAQFYLGYTLSTQGGDKVEAGKALDRAILYGGDDVKAAVLELRATGKVSPPPISGSKLRERIRESLRSRER